MTAAVEPTWGGTRSAIQFHYDIGNDFYALWLDSTRTYSCGLWGQGDDRDDLHAAQIRKMDFHLAGACADQAKRVLDIGCGWGSLLVRAHEKYGVERGIGLTLSDAQADHIEGLRLPYVEVHRESWTEHAPVERYDGIVSIGAFEHFAAPSDSPDRRIAIYRNFFDTCAGWLTREGRLSLQTIAYGTMRPKEASQFMQTAIFPDSELPCLEDIVAASRESFEIELLRNDRRDYMRTCELWLRGLRANRDRALSLVGEEVVARYEHYLKLCSVGFGMGRIALFRILMRPIRKSPSAKASDGDRS
jgi:cyclopropane-fatty-acyl-phospholipid synthase